MLKIKETDSIFPFSSDVCTRAAERLSMCSRCDRQFHSVNLKDEPIIEQRRFASFDC
jgi:hypothetical protein